MNAEVIKALIEFCQTNGVDLTLTCSETGVTAQFRRAQPLPNGIGRTVTTSLWLDRNDPRIDDRIRVALFR